MNETAKLTKEGKGTRKCNIIKFPVHTESYSREIEMLVLCDHMDQLRYPLTETQERIVKLIRDVEHMTEGASKEYFAVYKDVVGENLNRMGRSDLFWHVECMVDYVERKRKIERRSRMNKRVSQEKRKV